MDKKLLFVAPYGNDKSNGDLSSPLKTLNGIKSKLDELGYCGNVPVDVVFRGGTYDVSADSISFDEKLSGTAECPVRFVAYSNEKPVFNGGIRIPTEKSSKVTDEAILERIIDKKAALNLRVVDISDIYDKIEKYGKWNQYDNSMAITEGDVIITVNGLHMYPARWPKKDNPHDWKTDEGYIFVQHFEHEEPHAKMPFRMKLDKSTMSHIKTLWSESSMQNAWFAGYPWSNWNYEKYQVSGYDFENDKVTCFAGTDIPYKYEKEANCFKYRRIFFFNIFEELSDDTEYYIDRENKLFYYISSNNTDDIEFSFSPDLIGIKDASFISFEGIEFTHCNKIVISAVNSRNIMISDCVLSHCGNKGILFSKCFDCSVLNSHLFDFGGNGIIVQNCGIRKTITPGNILIEGNDIHDCGTIHRVYNCAINMDCNVHTVIRKNKLHSTPHMLIYLHCIDAVIEYNDIYDAVQDTDDGSAIYWGRAADVIGTTIRYNYFHRIGQKRTSTWGLGAIYADDMATSAAIYGNVFYHAAEFGDEENFNMVTHFCTTIKLNNAQFSDIHDNIIFIGTEHERPCEDARHREAIEWLKQSLGAYIPGDTDYPEWRFSLEQIGFFADDHSGPTALWAEHLKGTQWEKMVDLLSEDYFAKGAVDKNGDYYGIPEIRQLYYDKKVGRDEINDCFHKYMTEAYSKFGTKFAPNKFYRNIVVGMNPEFFTEDGDIFEWTYHWDNAYITSEEAAKMFVCIENENFTLTEEGKEMLGERLADIDCISSSPLK